LIAGHPGLVRYRHRHERAGDALAVRRYPDGDGLYLVVASATSKNWSYRYWKNGKQRWLGLGSVKDVSLKDARLARDAARLLVKGDRSTPGVDIVQEKRAAREDHRVCPRNAGDYRQYAGLSRHLPLAPIVRNPPYGVRELCAARWGMPSLWMEPDSGTHEYR
jgi:hypothetical protein